MTTIARVGTVVAFLLATGCKSDFARTNPYDPVVDVQISIAGPDTLFSWGEVGTYTASAGMAFPDSAFDFSVPIVTPIGRTGAAILVNASPPLFPATSTVTFSAMVGRLDTVKTISDPNPPFLPISIPWTTWRHAASRTVVVTQRITHIALRCPNTHACDTLSIAGTAAVWVDPEDALNGTPNGLHATDNPSTGAPMATFVIRDPTVASAVPNGIRVSNVTALKSGMTWIVGTSGAMLDSLRIVVR